MPPFDGQLSTMDEVGQAQASASFRRLPAKPAQSWYCAWRPECNSFPRPPPRRRLPRAVRYLRRPASGRGAGNLAQRRARHGPVPPRWLKWAPTSSPAANRPGMGRRSTITRPALSILSPPKVKVTQSHRGDASMAAHRWSRPVRLRDQAHGTRGRSLLGIKSLHRGVVGPDGGERACGFTSSDFWTGSSGVSARTFGDFAVSSRGAGRFLIELHTCRANCRGYG